MNPAQEPSTKIDCLNHGYVRLVDHMGSDLSAVRAARVSYDAAWRAGENEGSDTRLIKYLIRNYHTTPFEAITMTFEVKAPIFVFRQWHRHRTWSYNELSARYRELPEEFYLPTPELIGKQSKGSKQGRDLDGVMSNQEWEDRCLQIQIFKRHMEIAFDKYKQAIKSGWPRELARTILPLATYSVMQATVSLHNLFRFVSLRSDKHAQYEIRVYSDAMLDLAETFAPVSVGAYRERFEHG